MCVYSRSGKTVSYWILFLSLWQGKTFKPELWITIFWLSIKYFSDLISDLQKLSVTNTQLSIQKIPLCSCDKNPHSPNMDIWCDHVIHWFVFVLSHQVFLCVCVFCNSSSADNLEPNPSPTSPTPKTSSLNLKHIAGLQNIYRMGSIMNLLPSELKTL